MDEGIIVGIERKENAVKKSMEDLANVVAGGFQSALTLPENAFNIPSTAAINASYNITAANRQPIIVISQLDGKAVGYGVANYVTRQQTFERRSAAW